jgi:hypothetical protein
LKPYGTCRGCGQGHAIRTSGVITSHLADGAPTANRRQCSGVGRPPFEYTYSNTTETPGSSADKAVIIDALCELALADNLGDVRDAERHLWGLLGIAQPLGLHETPWRNTRDTLIAAGCELPSHLTEE